jgi:radical SAM enzyme (TIGR01210 family)
MAKRIDVNSYVTCYEERELLNGSLEKALVVILRTQGCRWAEEQGCLMCGYKQDSYHGEVPASALETQFESAMQKFSDHKMVKIFNSGSFLDENEIPVAVRTNIIKSLAEKKVRIVIESRPEYITADALEQLKSNTNDIEVALGLETASDSVNELCINKGSKFADYMAATRLLRDSRFRVRTYLLLKPPFLTENDSINDVWSSMEKIRELTDVISINPVNVQKGTMVEKLWQNNQYRPPWLWSLLEIFKRLRSWRALDQKPVVVSHPSGAGTRRGIHNCPKCDTDIINAVRKYSRTQESEVIEDAFRVNCDCFEEWQDLLELEEFTFASTGRLHD